MTVRQSCSNDSQQPAPHQLSRHHEANSKPHARALISLSVPLGVCNSAALLEPLGVWSKGERASRSVLGMGTFLSCRVSFRYGCANAANSCTANSIGRTVGTRGMLVDVVHTINQHLVRHIVVVDTSDTKSGHDTE